MTNDPHNPVFHQLDVARERIAQLESTTSKLAAEIAELKADKFALFDSREKLNQENAALRAELETARKERESDKAKLLTVSALSVEQLVQRHLDLLRKSTRENLPPGFDSWDAYHKYITAALAAKDAAEKRVAEVDKLFVDVLEVLEQPAWNYNPNGADTEECRACGAEVEIWGNAPGGPRKRELIHTKDCVLERLRALTPAPTQEPPAGGVTISTEKKGGEAGMFIESPPMKGASDVQPEGRPADVPSEGRGESKVRCQECSWVGDWSETKIAGGYDRRAICPGCGASGDFIMLPTEGSGA